MLRSTAPAINAKNNRKKLVFKFSSQYGITGLVLKIEAIDGKKVVKFVAIQQNSATFIYDRLKHNKRFRGELPLKRCTTIQCSSVSSLKNPT